MFVKAAVVFVVLLIGNLVPCPAQDWFSGPIPSDAPCGLMLPVVGDLNHDGFDDLVAQDAWCTKGRVFLSQADGHMALQDSFPVYFGPSMGLIDENGDGHLDILWSDTEYTHVERNDGLGNFQAAGYYFRPTGPYAAADLDGDGYQDLVGGGSEYNCCILYGSSGGLDWSHPEYMSMTDGVGTPMAYNQWALGDIDDDGRMDILGVAGGSDLETDGGAFILWRLGTGNRQYSDCRTIRRGELGSSYSQCTLGDADRDRDLDLVCKPEFVGGRYFLYEQAADTFLCQANQFGSGPLHFAYLNDDDAMDAVRRDGAIFMGDGAGNFQQIATLAGETCLPGQFLGDGGLDVLSVWRETSDSEIACWENITLPPADVTEAGGLSPESALLVWPSITTGKVSIRWTGAQARGQSIEILDVAGRVIRTLPLIGSRAIWDTRNRSGELVSSGVYWARVEGRGHGTAIHVVR